MLVDLFEYFNQYEELLILVSLISAVVFVLTLLLTPYLLGLIASDYFTMENPHKLEIKHIGHIIAVIIKSVIGLALLLAGIIMLVTPGQGVISILLGLFLMEFPGKRKLELKIINHDPTFKTLNWLREKASKPPFKR
ncbi:PGPGW domain-containing protein [Candidatus Thioglobus autotrophicus]|uniref:PGPGW domain-containing protein n=1 Tax=Candidatus Thioglobus autotrophicus TaxID=1705394 RepID=UPI00299DE436|nr:PGPGW domain-containing protein [Candidatus Thioglobus autotrophicus]WPE16951.1 PGPGW domain-containing protein [Candidatus Thioglobus autotrophicus]